MTFMKESFIKDRLVVHQVTTSGTVSDNKWQRVIQQMTASSTTSDNKWQRMVQQMKTNKSKWEWF